MKQQRKEILLSCFPPVPENFLTIMKTTKPRQSARNYVVFLTDGKELFARCFHRYSKGQELVERQRYVFARDGAVRYGHTLNPQTGHFSWIPRKEFREPVFVESYGYGADNSYSVLNTEAIRKAEVTKYLPAESLQKHRLVISLLKLYCRHPNVEYLMKAGYDHLIQETITGYYGGKISLSVHGGINWKTNHLLKMLRLSRTEFKLLCGKERTYECYIYWRNHFPRLKPQEILTVALAFRYELGTARTFEDLTQKRIVRIAAYLLQNHIPAYQYRDYLEQCRRLQYDLHDTAICFPHDFDGMHTRLSQIIQYEKNAEMQKSLSNLYEQRKRFEFAFGELRLIQPKHWQEIIDEGAALSHCVGGYADRHAQGITNIFFIRKISEPDTPYFTIEVNNNYTILQCHGYRNDVNGKPEEINAFEKQYQHYLEGLRHEQHGHQSAV